MENQRSSYMTFNRYYNHMADVFVRFCLTIGPLNPALLSEYVPLLHTERQLVYLGLTSNSRFLYHHLVGGFCIYQCNFCAIVAQFPLRNHRRNCTYCREHRRRHLPRYRRSCIQLQIQPNNFNMPPLHITSVRGNQVVSHLSITHACNLINVVLQFVPSSIYLHELQTELLFLLHLNRLNYYTLNLRFMRHLANL